MKILYIHQYFTTPKEAGATRSYYLSKAFIAKGDQVTLLTGANISKLYSVEYVEDIKVIKIKSDYSNKLSKFNRIYSYLKFMFFSTFLALKEKNIDIVYATSTPISVGIPGIIVSTLKRAKFIFEVRDLWPDVPYEMKIINNKFIFKLLKLSEKFIYSRANYIVTISEGIKDKIEAKFHKKIGVFPFGSNLKLFSNIKNDSWKLENNILQNTLYIFTGSIGIANDMKYLINAVKILKEKNIKDIFIAIFGDGSTKKETLELINSHNLKNIKIFPPVPIEGLSKIYQSADAGIILFGRKSETYRYTASPNKFFDYIAGGLPFFFNFDGPLKKEIEKYNIGIYTDYMNAKDLAEKMVFYSQNKDLLKEMAENGYKLAKTKYNREKILNNLVEKIHSQL